MFHANVRRLPWPTASIVRPCDTPESHSEAPMPDPIGTPGANPAANDFAKSVRSVLFLGKSADWGTRKALELCRFRFARVQAHLGNWGTPLPSEALAWSGDILISYLSRWIVPKHLLRAVRVAALNFHPGSPAYPGFACYNFALYEQPAEYGVTCHHMSAGVDCGPIVAVERFPLLPSDSLNSLQKRTYRYQLSLFTRIIQILSNGHELPISNESWTRHPFTRKDLAQLHSIPPEATLLEIARRIRATSFSKQF